MSNQSEFKNKLFTKINESQRNNYTDNYDYHRFGIIKPEKGFKQFLRKKFIEPNYIAKWDHQYLIYKILVNMEYMDDYEWLYSNLNDTYCQDLLVTIIAYRILGHQYVKLPLSRDLNWSFLDRVESCITEKLPAQFNFPDMQMNKYHLKRLGYDIYLISSTSGVLATFVYNQYSFSNTGIEIGVKEGDVVIDAGACWGDTALNFARKIKGKGMVYSFEFVPKNIELFQKNIALNPKLANNITLINSPLWDADDQQIYYLDKGPSTTVFLEEIHNYTGIAKTITIDSWVEQNNLPKVDFIKMDIEGAELKALQGAIKTIKKHKPTLAISIYHSFDDFTQIPKWIDNLDCGYKLYLEHYTIHEEETVLLAVSSS